MKTIRQRCPEATRLRLLDAAHREMYEYGYQAASLDRILADTGLTKGALYHHFGTKQRLGIAVVEEVVGARLRREWIEPVLHAPHPLETLIERIDQSQRRATELSIRLGCDLNNLMQEMSPLDAAFRHVLADVIGEWRGAWESALRHAQETGELRSDVDCTRAVLFIIAAIEGCSSLSKTQLSVADYRDCLEGVQDYLASLRAC